MLKIASTQKSVGGVLANLKELLGNDKAKYSQYEAAILRALGGQHQLAAISDEDLREHLVLLRQLLSALAVRNHPLPALPRGLLPAAAAAPAVAPVPASPAAPAAAMPASPATASASA